MNDALTPRRHMDFMLEIYHYTFLRPDKLDPVRKVSRGIFSGKMEMVQQRRRYCLRVRTGRYLGVKEDGALESRIWMDRLCRRSKQ